VATRLAVIYLMNHKPDRALATITSTRSPELPTEVRTQRLLIEARALADIGRHDVALEVIGNLDGREAVRLRSDILWGAKRWRESAEQIELLHGDRWRDWHPLGPPRLRGAERAARPRLGRIPPARPDGRGGRHARGVPARSAHALSGDRLVHSGRCPSPAIGPAVAGAGRGAGHDRLGAPEAEGARGGQVIAAVRIVTAI
jgi:hypothetical protein